MPNPLNNQNAASPPVPNCPKCGCGASVVEKLILIGKASPGSKIEHFEEVAGYRRQDQLAVDECLPDSLRAAPQQQFIDGYFCNACGTGFVSDESLKNRCFHELGASHE